MALQADIRLEIDNVDIEGVEGGAFEGGEFSVREFAAVGNRGFLEVNYFRMDDKKEELAGLYMYELDSFDPAPFKGMTLTSKKFALLNQENLVPLKMTGLDESRLVKLDEADFEATVAQAVGKEVAPTETPIASPGDGLHKTVIAQFVKR